MRIIAARAIRAYQDTYPAARTPLARWVTQIQDARWTSLHAATQSLFRPDPVGADRLVFNIAGNQFRLIVCVDFQRELVYVKWFGTHAEYDRIDASTADNHPRGSS